jgi:hypothetical protein
MIRLCILISILFLTIDLSAEMINGPANIRIEAQKEVFVSLFDSVEVRCAELKDNWFQIVFTIKVSEDIYENQRQINKGEKLFDFNGKEIGIAIADIPLNISSSWSSGGTPGNPKRFGMEIYGYTHKDNIYNWSIPENPLNEIISDNKNNLTLVAFNKFINEFKFENNGLLKELAPFLTEYMIYENDIDDPSPLDRIRLIFEGQKLIAIVHSRNLGTTDFRIVNIQRNMKLTIFALPKNMDEKTLIEINNKAYLGVD